MSFAAAEADRRVANMIQIGTVTAVNGAAGTVRVRCGDLDTAEVSVMAQRGGAVRMWSMPSVGEQVVLACPSGDVSRGVVLGSIWQSNAPSSDAGVPMLDLGGGKLIIKGDVEIEGKVEVTEDVIADSVSLVHHTHGGVVTGGNDTAEPNQ